MLRQVNDKIKQLAEQARQEFLELPTKYTAEQVGMYPQLMERFAELIIKECVDIANDTRFEGRVVANRIRFVFGLDTISPENRRARCDALITAMIGKDFVPNWWNSPNNAFGGNTPEQAYSTAPDAVYAYLMKSAEGEW